MPVFVNMLVYLKDIAIMVGKKFGNCCYQSFPVTTMNQ